MPRRPETSLPPEHTVRLFVFPSRCLVNVSSSKYGPSVSKRTDKNPEETRGFKMNKQYFFFFFYIYIFSTFSCFSLCFLRGEKKENYLLNSLWIINWKLKNSSNSNYSNRVWKSFFFFFFFFFWRTLENRESLVSVSAIFLITKWDE